MLSGGFAVQLAVQPLIFNLGTGIIIIIMLAREPLHLSWTKGDGNGPDVREGCRDCNLQGLLQSFSGTQTLPVLESAGTSGALCTTKVTVDSMPDCCNTWQLQVKQRTHMR